MSDSRSLLTMYVFCLWFPCSEECQQSKQWLLRHVCMCRPQRFSSQQLPDVLPNMVPYILLHIAHRDSWHTPAYRAVLVLFRYEQTSQNLSLSCRRWRRTLTWAFIHIETSVHNHVCMAGLPSSSFIPLELFNGI